MKLTGLPGSEGAPTDGAPQPAAPPVLRVVRGDASPEEIAAIVALLSARSAPTQAPPPPRRSAFSDPASGLRRPLPLPGPGAWEQSGRAPGVRTSAGW
ncbi:MAG: acyl-CoA carboxylase subunit epsilon [Frankia sp.]